VSAISARRPVEKIDFIKLLGFWFNNRVNITKSVFHHPGIVMEKGAVTFRTSYDFRPSPILTKFQKQRYFVEDRREVCESFKKGL
jgi:hypothetical protein